MITYRTPGHEVELAADFMRTHWEREPRLAEHVSGTGFRDMFSTARLEELLAFGVLRPGFITVVQYGRPVTTDLLCRAAEVGGVVHEDLIDPAAVEGYRKAGATVILAALHMYSPPVAATASSFRAFFGREVEAHAFHTPADTTGLSAHADGEDNFLFQMAGNKQWTLHPPLTARLPVSGWHPRRDQLPDPATGLTITIRAGDVLYIPRGWLHSSTSGQGGSLHVTFQVLPTLIRSCLLDRAEQEIFTHVAEDEVIPVSGTGQASPLAESISKVAAALQAWAAEIAGDDGDGQHGSPTPAGQP